MLPESVGWGSAPEVFGVTTPKVKGGLKASPTESLCSAAQRVITETSQNYLRDVRECRLPEAKKTPVEHCCSRLFV